VFVSQQFAQGGNLWDEAAEHRVSTMLTHASCMSISIDAGFGSICFGRDMVPALGGGIGYLNPAICDESSPRQPPSWAILRWTIAASGSSRTWVCLAGAMQERQAEVADLLDT
jgi:hypothetical protein